MGNLLSFVQPSHYPLRTATVAIAVIVLIDYYNKSVEQRRKQILEEQRVLEELHRQEILQEQYIEEILEEQYRKQILEEQRRKQILEEQRRKQILEEQRRKQILENQRREQILDEQRRKQLLEEQRKKPDQQQKIIRQQQEQLHSRLAAQRLAEHRELIRQQQEKLTISTVTLNSNLIQSILRCPETNNWAPSDYTHATVRLANLANSSPEYQRINKLFAKTNKKFFKVTAIERIQNPYLMAGFLLKMEEMERLGYNPQVTELFHGTKRCFVDSIVNKNFDWRKHGENRGYKFGKGVSFTPISNYATNYGDKDMENNVMFVVKVLVGTSCIGNETMILPAAYCDTSEKPNGHVVVKYEDNDFYPAYKITYSCSVKPKIANKRRHN